MSAEEVCKAIGERIGLIFRGTLLALGCDAATIRTLGCIAAFLFLGGVIALLVFIMAFMALVGGI